VPLSMSIRATSDVYMYKSGNLLQVRV
jgi:hypothetical protein